MKKIILFALIACMGSLFLFAQEEEDEGLFSAPMFERAARAADVFPPDVFRDDFLRTIPERFEDAPFFDVYPFEARLKTLFSYGIHNNTFHFRDAYASFGQTFHNAGIQFTPFLTLHGYFDTHNPSIDYPYVKANAGFYDGGVQTVCFDRVLFGVRGRAAFDVNTRTFLLMPHYYEAKNPAARDTPAYYIPQTLNGPGVRAGVLGERYELAYSQGDYRHSIPKAALLRVTLPLFELRALYEHENRRAPENYDPALFDSLAQAAITYRDAFFNDQISVGAIFEYTWRERDAHYARFEQSVEWNIVHCAFREWLYFKDQEMRFYLEASIFAKFKIDNGEFALGVHAATDGRYYLLGTVAL